MRNLINITKPLSKVFNFTLNFQVILLLSFTILKIIVANYIPSSNDVSQMLSAGQALISGEDILDSSNTGGNPSYFLYGHSIIVVSSIFISNIFPISFDLAIKIPSILSDFIISLILLKNSRGGALSAFVYMFNPVTFLLSVYHGQLHTVAVLGAVLSVCFLKSQSLFLSGFALALTSSIRQNFSVMIILLTKKSGRLLHPSLILFFSILFFINIPLIGSPHLMNVFNPVSNYGMWGYTLLLNHFPKLLLLLGFNSIEVLLSPINKTLSLYGGFFYIFWAIIFSLVHWYGKFNDEWTATLCLLLGFFTVGTGFGIQRLVWVIPFFLIYSLRKGSFFILLASNFLIGSYWQWTLNIKYNVDSITANLDILNRFDLLGLVFVGIFGFATWLYCTYELYNLLKKN